MKKGVWLEVYKDLFLTYKDFDLKSAIMELQQWQDDLEDNYEDEIIRNVLEGVKDIIFDNCTFE